MALTYKEDTYSYDGNFVLGSLNKFKQAERRLAVKKQALDDFQNEYNLIEQQALSTYKENVQYLMLDQKTTINACKQWQTMLTKNQDKDGNKLDKRKKYAEKEIYDWYVEYVRKLLGVDSMDDVEFIDFNFGQATDIQFNFKEHKWEMRVPHVETINLEYYRNHGKEIFKLSLFHKDTDRNCFWTQFASTYEEDELKDLMIQGVEKYCT